jgi:SPP1 family predicted phage head-tail adaptor
MTIQAGTLDKRVELLTLNGGRMADGAEQDAPPVVVATVWASVTPISGREYMQAKALQEEQTTRIVIRYRADVTPKMRARWGTHLYDIIDVRHVDMGYVTLELMCREIDA